MQLSETVKSHGVLSKAILTKYDLDDSPIDPDDDSLLTQVKKLCGDSIKDDKKIEAIQLYQTYL